MANSILGAGIIGLPYAIRQAGFVTGITLLILLAGVTDWTIRLVVLNAKLSGRGSYIEVMEQQTALTAGDAPLLWAMGFRSSQLLPVCVCFWRVSPAWSPSNSRMCAFNVIIGDSIPHVIAAVFPFLKDHLLTRLLVNRRFIIILCTVAVSFPLSLHRDIVKLSKSSSFALVSMGVIVVSVVVRSLGVDDSLKGSHHGVTVIQPGVFAAIGVISFAVSFPLVENNPSSCATTTPCSSTNRSKCRRSTASTR